MIIKGAGNVNSDDHVSTLFWLKLEVPYSMSKLRKKKEQNKCNYIENQESKRQPPMLVYSADPENEKAASRTSYYASPEKKRAASRASYRADPEKRREASRVPLFKAYL